MNRSSDDSIDEAIDWMIALQEDPSDPALMDRFERWRRASPANASAWREVRRTKSAVRAAGPAEAERFDDLPGEAMAARRASGRGSRRAAAGLVAVAAIACLLALAWPQLRISLEADHLTGAGEMRKVELADGSIVHLGANSAISVSYDQQGRNVELLQGNAFFSVRRDVERPFRVRFGDAETVVLGTRFEVRMTARGAAVAVSDGSVLVNYRDGSSSGREDPQRRLARGDAVRLGWAGKQLEKVAVEPRSVASWRTGKLVVDNWPVADVVDELERYFRGTVVTGPGAASARRITGIYDLDDPEQALRLVAATQGATVYRVSPWVLVIPGL